MTVCCDVSKRHGIVGAALQFPAGHTQAELRASHLWDTRHRIHHQALKEQYPPEASRCVADVSLAQSEVAFTQFEFKNLIICI
jgi:hypothetical protein